MATCATCGEFVAAGASFCASCGRATPVAPREVATKDTRTAENLILAGALLGGAMLVLAGLFLLVLGLVLGFAFDPLTDGDGPSDLLFFPFSFLDAVLLSFTLFGVVVLGFGAVWTWAALRARHLLRAGDVNGGSVWAIVSGTILLVLGLAPFLPAVAGGLVLAGGLLARRRG